VLLVRRSMIVFLAAAASAVVAVAKPAAMDGAVNAWEQLAARVAAVND
jgi:hypothetical protein